MPIRRLLAAALAAALAVAPAAAQDKSAASVVQLPSAGGTVTREEGAFTLEGNTGSANFRLPLPELPQRGRFGPTVTLAYNQFAGDAGGGLGVGWSLSVPSIAMNDDLGTAIPGRKPDGDFFARLSYMGARLVFLGVEGGVARYRPEVSERAVEIVHHPRPFEVATLGPTGETVVETVPSGFEVREPDGARLIFTGDPAVAEGGVEGGEPYVARWPLALHVNANREAVRYSYEKHGGRSYLTRIAFAGGQSVYEFDLIDTRPSLVSHVTGARQQNAKLYGRMTARFRGTVYGRWCMGYLGRASADDARFEVRAHPDCLETARRDLEPLIDPNAVTVLDQLRALYRFGDDRILTADVLQFPRIRFDYSSWTAAELAARDLVFEAPAMAWAGDVPPASLELADLDMDALVDIVRTTDDGATVFLGGGELATAFDRSTPLTLTRPTEAGLLRPVAPRLADDRFHFADVFGDSYVDILEIEPGVLHVFDGRADGSFPYLGRSVALPGVSPTTFTDGAARFLDLNMDGRSDIVTTRLDADGRTEWRFLLNLTRREADGGHSVNFGAVSRRFPFASRDGLMLSRRSSRLADVNGDRLPDFLMIRPADRGFCVYENQGRPFTRDAAALPFGDVALSDPLCGPGRFARLAGLEPTDSLETMWTVDVNGDGILDFASIGARTDELRVWLGFGDGSFLSRPLTLALNLRVQVGTAAQTFRSRVADIDADGQDEIVVFQKPAGAEVRAVVVIDFNRTATAQLVKSNLLTTVDFASGRRHDIRYATSTDEMLRDRAAGRPSRKLHFPVVVAKQMVTSEGAPGAERVEAQTEEFFYHDPFYDVINRRFIGFEEVDRVAYGDEFLGDGRTTQRSGLTRERYYAFAERAADLHLAGKLKVRRIYEASPDPLILASAEATDRLDPAEEALHSLSTATRAQALPRAGALLRCEAETWVTAAREGGGAWLRRTAAQLTAAAGEEQAEDASADACRAPVKIQSFEAFDAYNLHGVETVTVRDLAAPGGLTAPGFSRTTQVDYAASRAALAPLGIVDAVAERRILSGVRVLSRERFAYRPESGGRLGERALDVFSGLARTPEPLAALHRPTHTLIRGMAYDVFGNIVEMTDGLGRTEAASFDATGTLPQTHTRFAGGEPRFDQVTRMAYDGPREGLVARQTTPLGLEIRYDYDALGRRVAETAADGAESRFLYRFGEGGAPSLILTQRRRYASAAETPAGESEWIEQLAAYNARGNRIADAENVTGGGVRVFNFARYNRNEREVFRWTPFVVTRLGEDEAVDLRDLFAFGDVPRPTGAVGNAYAYDAAGRMILETHPSGKVSRLAHHPWGTRRVTTYDDEHAGSVATEELRVGNENGLAALATGDGRGTTHVVRFARDAFGYLREILLPGETEPRRFVFNSIGDLELQQIPGMGDHYAFYDARGRQSARARVAADGTTETLSFEYDFLNRKIAERENGETRVRIVYDDAAEIAAADPAAIPLPLGKVARVLTTDPNGLFDAEQRFGYDANGRLIRHETAIGGRVFAETYGRTLDAVIDSSTGPGGLTSRFSLGPDQNLRSVTLEHPAFAGPETVIEDIAYNAEGRIARIAYRAGASTELAYDPATLFLKRIVTTTRDGPLQDLTMTFNGAGSITGIADALAGADPARGHVDRSGRFEYDFRNQLVRYDRFGEASAFVYDAAGSFLRNDDLAPGAALARDPATATGLIPAGAEAGAYAFDGFGQIARSPRLAAAVFDAYGRLIRAQTATEEIAFGYDQTGRRIYRRRAPLDGGGAPALTFYPLESFETGSAGDESFVTVGPSRLARMEHATGRWFYYLKDHLESTDHLMTADGRPVEQMLYRAYGTERRPETLSPAWAERAAALGAAAPAGPTRHRFTGKPLDEETGLYYHGARYYDPALGRFVSPDPLYLADPERCGGNPIACTLFAYANNNPMAFVDPTGLDGVVAGDEAYRRRVEESLNRIDPTARVDKETGQISQSWLHGAWLYVKNFFVPGSNMETGRELVSRVIESPQTTTIQFSKDDAAARGADPTVNFMTTPGDAVVDFDPSYSTTLPEFDPSTGAVAQRAPDPGIVIGHELIHATHIMAGQVSGVGAAVYTGLDGTPQIAMDEEARTVGVGGTPRPDDITENQLREMIGVNPRNHY